MEIQILNQKIKEILKSDDELKMKLAKANKKTIRTIDQWRRDDDMILTTVTNLQIIREHLNLPEKEVLTEPTEIIA